MNRDSGSHPAPVLRRQLSLPSIDRRDLQALAGLSSLAVLILWRAVLAGEVFFRRDVGAVWHAQVEAFVRAIGAGSWPLWDTSVAFGQPFLGNPNAQVLYPPNWSSLLLPASAQYTLYALVHLAFAGIGLYLLARELGASRLAAVIGAGVWMTSGPLLSLVDVWHHFAGAAWLPWVLFAANRALGASSLAPSLVWGAATGLQLLAGSPDLVLLTNLVVGAWLATRLDWRQPLSPRNRNALGRAALAWGFGAALSAAQWVPTLELVSRAERSAMSPANRTVWSVHPLSLPQLLLPIGFEDLPLVDPQDTGPLEELWQPFVYSIYLGLPALALVAAGASDQGHRRLRRFLLALWLASLLYALGRHTPFHAVAVTLLPPLGVLRYPSKFMPGAALAWALLAALGVDALRAPGRARRAAAVALGLALGACALALAMGQLHMGLPAGATSLLAAEAVPLAVGLALGAGALVVALAPGPLGTRRLAALGLIAVADLAIGNARVNPTGDARLFRYRPEVLDVVGVGPEHRIYVWDYAIRLPRKRAQDGMLGTFLEVAGPWPPYFEQAVGFQAYLYPPIAGRWGLSGSFDRDLLHLYPAYLSQLTMALRWAEETPAFARLLRLGGVEHVIALHQKGHEELTRVAAIDGPYRVPILVFRVPDTLPRAYAVGASRVADGDDALRAMVDPGFDSRAEVLLADGPAVAGTADFAGDARVSELAPDRVTIDARLSAPGYVVLLDSYDPGWRARVDGEVAEVRRANLAFRAVPVPAGEHRIELVYRPPAVLWGLAVSSCALVAAAGVAARRALGGPEAPGRPRHDGEETSA